MAGYKDLGPYNRMWPKRFVIPLWTLELILSLGTLAWVLFNVIFAGAGRSRVEIYAYRQQWRSGTPFVIINSILAVVLALSIIFDISAIILFSKKKLRPACYLTFQCIRLVALITMVLVFWIMSSTFLTSLLITLALPFAITQLVYGAVVVHRNREGIYRQTQDGTAEHDLEEAKDMTTGSTEHILPISEKKPKKNRGAYNRMWPKRFVVTFWTLDLLAFLAVCFCSIWLAISFFNDSSISGGPTTTIMLSICSACCAVGTGLDVAIIVSFCRSNLQATTYLLYQCIKATIFFIVILISAVSSFAAPDAILGIPIAASPFLLAAGQLIYGAVVLHREKDGFYLPEEATPTGPNGEEVEPHLHHVCVACGLHRPASVYAYRGDDGTILTPTFSSRYGESETLRSGPVWSIGSDAAPPYSWKGSVTGPPSVMSSSLLEARSGGSPGSDWDAMSADIAIAGVTEEPRIEEDSRQP